MERKINLSIAPEMNCPRYEFCSINKCPLSREFENLRNDSSDPSVKFKEKCTSKNIRHEIGKVFGLKYEGLKTREYNGLRNWARKKDFIGDLHGEKILKPQNSVSGPDDGGLK